MAPRRGGGSSSSSTGDSGSSDSSGSFCAYCSVPLELTNEGWTSAVSWAYLAVAITNLVVVLFCLIAVGRRPWLNPKTGKKDHSKLGLFMTAGILMFIALALVISDQVLHLVQITTTRLYWITYIFRKAGFNFSDVFMFALIYKCIEAARNDAPHWKPKTLRIVHMLILITLSFLQVISLAWYIYYIVAYFSGYTQSRSALPPIDVAYAALAFVISIEIIYWSVSMSLRKQLYKHSQWLLTPISLLIFLSSLVSLIYIVGADYTFGFYTPLSWAYSFITSIVSIIVFICLTKISRGSYRRFHDVNHNDRYDGATVGLQDYASPSPYASEQTSHVYTSEGYHYNQHLDTSYEPSSLQSQPWKPDPTVQEMPAAHRSYGWGPQYASVPSGDHH